MPQSSDPINAVHSSSEEGRPFIDPIDEYSETKAQWEASSKLFPSILSSDLVTFTNLLKVPQTPI
jgi:hypothetical protein